MKTSNNNQQSGNGQVSKMTLRTSVVLVSVVLISLSVSAQDLWKELTNTAAYGKMTSTLDMQSAETKNADDAIDAINSELALLWDNLGESPAKAVMEESPAVTNEMALESFLSDAEQQTAEGTDAEIAKYAEKVMTVEEKEEALVMESPMSNESFLSDAEQQTAESAAAEIAKYAEKTLNAVETEKSAQSESPMSNERFLQDAEQQTAESAAAEIMKYAEKVMSASENEESLVAQNSETSDDFFKDAEQFTADGSDAQIAHYAEKLMNNKAMDTTTAYESWSLNADHLNN